MIKKIKSRKVFEVFHNTFTGIPEQSVALITLKVFSKIIAIRSLDVNIPLKVFYNTLSGIVGNNSLRGFCGLITLKVFSQIMTAGSIDVNAPLSRFSSIPLAAL